MERKIVEFGNLLRKSGVRVSVAEAIVWACSQRAAYLNGQEIVLDGSVTA